MSKILDKYTNPSNPGSFSGIHSFKKNNLDKGVKKVLKSTETYTLHKPQKRKFLRRKTFVKGIDYIWQVDLIDLKKFKHQNSHYTYLLTCIDSFSRYVWVIPLKNKSSKECKEAFRNIFKKDNRKPQYIYSDMGNEFKGECKKYLKEQSVSHIDTKSVHKASIVERFNRTLKEKMFRFFSYTKKYRYIDVLAKLVDNYNNSYHRSIQMKPSQVKESNEQKVFDTLYNKDDDYVVKYHFKVSDYVREVVDKKVFEKGYTPNWSKEIYLIHARYPTNPPTYEIQSLDGKNMSGNTIRKSYKKFIGLMIHTK